MRFRKKGQEEVVGFVAIIVIVAIVILFLIGISIRNDEPEAARSVEIKQFLEASQRYTSDCELAVQNRYASMNDLIRTCYENKDRTCIDGRNACKVYTENMQKIINNSFAYGEGYSIKGIVYTDSYAIGKNSENIVEINEGDCSGNYKSEEILSPDAPSRGTYVKTMKICS